jgi:hypothetical protein
MLINIFTKMLIKTFWTNGESNIFSTQLLVQIFQKNARSIFCENVINFLFNSFEVGWLEIKRHYI